MSQFQSRPRPGPGFRASVLGVCLSLCAAAPTAGQAPKVDAPASSKTAETEPAPPAQEKSQNPVSASDSMFADPALGLVVWALILVASLALIGYIVCPRIPLGWQRSIYLMIVLVIGFVLLALLTPFCDTRPLLGAALFLGALGLFRLMSRFESSG
jgi:hypothetical protein